MNDESRPSLTRRITRRRFLAVSAAVASAAAATSLKACGGDGGGTPTGAVPSPSPAASPTIAAARGVRGGTLRVYNFDALQPDSLDPHLTQVGPIANVHALVFSRLLRYEDVAAGVLAPDLAETIPEQPDDTTYVVRLRPGVRFHDSHRTRYVLPKAAGRELTADDVKYSIERQMATTGPQAKRLYRRGQWSVIESIRVRDRRTLVIRTKQPVAPFLSFLAGPHAFIVAPESVGETGEVSSDAALMGTGPFMLDAFEQGVRVRLVRNPGWYARGDDRDGAGGPRPFIDAYEAYVDPQEDVFLRVMFERRVVDATGFGDARALDQAHKTNLADIALEETDGWWVLSSRLLLDRAPFRDDRVRRALHLAIDRAALRDALFPGIDGRPSARYSGPIAPGLARFGLTEEQVARRPGYRSDAASRAEDIAEARRLWSAAFGDASPPPLRAVFAGAPRTIPDRAVEELRRQLRETLGWQVQADVDPSGHVLIGSALRRNVDGAAEGAAPFTFMFEDGGPDLDDWLYARFRSGQPDNSFRLQDAQLDGMLDRSRGEFDAEARAQLGRDIQDYLLANVNAQIEYMAPVSRRLTWGYVRNSQLPPLDGAVEHLADVWLDRTHPAWAGRPELS